MTRRDPEPERDHWAAFEYASEILDDIRGRLKAGSKGRGAALSAEECEFLLNNLKTLSPPNSRPAMNWVEKQQTVAAIARYCRDLEKSMTLKNAVAGTEKRFDCSRSTVYAARKAFSSK